MTINGIGTGGLAAGRAFIVDRTAPAAVRQKGSPAQEQDAFEEALEAAMADLSALSAHNDIFAAHLEMLEDPMLFETVSELIGEGIGAAEAVETACARICMMFSGVDDEYLRERMNDVRDVCLRVKNHITGASVNCWDSLQPGSIVVADELLPSDTAAMDLSRVAGFLTSKGSRTSHVCIIAGNNGIPAIVGADISGISMDDVLLMDADLGEVTLRPSQVEMDAFEARMDASAEDRKESLLHACEPAIASDGRSVPVLANAGSADEVAAAVEAGADGIGLFRTELVFMQGDALPSEEKQYDAYRAAVLACAGRPLTIRTLDIGGDKPLPYMEMPREDNPFLGLRGIRFCLRHPEVFFPQLRAILRASAHGKVRVMFPMVATLAELDAAKSCLSECQDQLRTEGVAFDENIEVGIMIETPAAVIMADTLAAECSFFSIGTNDLVQYLHAADRGNPEVAYLNDHLTRGVARALAMTIDAAHKAGVRVAMCGQMAADPQATQLLLGLGLDAFSVPAPSVAEIKQLIRKA